MSVGRNLVAVTSLVDELLADQQRLTAVERFSQFHEWTGRSSHAGTYESLLPLSKPGAGEQYRFEVDLDACSGCKACVTACHSLNGLDEGESWRDVDTLFPAGPDPASPQTVTAACHHCVDPACANGCPTLAYERSEETGIVKHLDDQCIGCQYCTLTCPYGAPKYNTRLGIVRKCDLCQDRLREGEAPACVQACPNGAIRIRLVRSADVLTETESGTLLPGALPSLISRPSTRYVNLGRDLRAPVGPPRPAHGHTPLAIMLVLTQAAAGILAVDAIASPGPWHTILGTLFALAGLAAATAHLGRPLQAWKSFLGWRRSWLSREILAFGLWSGLAVTNVILVLSGWFPLFSSTIASATAATGLLGVFTSVMVYAVTRRPSWSLPLTGTRFALTTIALGGIFAAPVLSMGAVVLGILFEETLAKTTHTARILGGKLRPMRLAAHALRIAGLLFLVLSMEEIAFALLLAGEGMARSNFFRAVEPPSMPGGAAA
jgi:Fe-S-cluster-containing dehydrogenase component/DMSO reductase anchor subunit